MSISIDSSYLGLANQVTGTSNVNTDKLTNNLNNISAEATDEELLDACKEFEQYFVEQVIKKCTSTLSEFKDNDYMECFGDTLIESYAESITDSGQLGMAQMLYESMKNNNIR